MIDFLFAGIIFGFVAGISPGPLLTLVISETIRYNRKEGIKIALSPLLTDFPIMMLAIFFAFKFSEYDILLGIISFLGAAFVFYLAIENIKVTVIQQNSDSYKSKSYRKGIIANFLSPHPYLFWLLVGAPFTIKAYENNLITAFLFIASFYIFIVGTKIAIAFLSEKTKNILSSRSYVIVVKVLGFVLLLFSIVLIIDGLKFLNLI